MTETIGAPYVRWNPPLPQSQEQWPYFMGIPDGETQEVIRIVGEKVYALEWAADFVAKFARGNSPHKVDHFLKRGRVICEAELVAAGLAESQEEPRSRMFQSMMSVTWPDAAGPAPALYVHDGGWTEKS